MGIEMTDLEDAKGIAGVAGKPQFRGEKTITTLKEASTLIMGQSPSSDSYNADSNGLPFYQGNADFGEDNPTPRIWCTDPKKIAEKGDILISVRAPIGAINIADEQCCIGRGIAAIRPNTELVSRDYLRHQLCASRDKLEAMGTGSTFKAIGKKALGGFAITIYPKKGQETIAYQFNWVAEHIKLANSQLAQLDNLVKSRFNELFGKVVENDLHFPVIKLDDVCTSIVRGPFGSALKKEFFVPKGPGTYKVYEQKHAIQKRADIGIYYIDGERYESLNRFECHPGDILMSCSGTMGELYQLPPNCEPGVINQALCKFSLSDAIQVEYFLGCMNQIVDQLGAKGSGIKNVSSVKFIKAIEIPLPPITLQRDFATFSVQVDKLRFDVQQQIDKLELLKSSLMQEYFG